MSSFSYTQMLNNRNPYQKEKKKCLSLIYKGLIKEVGELQKTEVGEAKDSKKQSYKMQSVY